MDHALFLPLTQYIITGKLFYFNVTVHLHCILHSTVPTNILTFYYTFHPHLCDSNDIMFVAFARDPIAVLMPCFPFLILRRA